MSLQHLMKLRWCAVPDILLGAALSKLKGLSFPLENENIYMDNSGLQFGMDSLPFPMEHLDNLGSTVVCEGILNPNSAVPS